MVYHYHISSKISRISGRLQDLSKFPQFVDIKLCLHSTVVPGCSIIVHEPPDGLSFSLSDSISPVVPGGDTCITVISNTDQREMKSQNQSGSLSMSELYLSDVSSDLRQRIAETF